MLLAFVMAAGLSAGLAGPAPVDAAEPIGFRLESATVHRHGLDLGYRTSCRPGATGPYGLSVTVAQRTGAHVAIATGTLREPCAGRSRHVLLVADPGGMSFRSGAALARVWGCVGAGCSESRLRVRVA